MVCFLEENTTAVVPTSWVKAGVCKWPSEYGHSRVQRAVKTQEEPGDDWEDYDVRLMGKPGEF